MGEGSAPLPLPRLLLLEALAEEAAHRGGEREPPVATPPHQRSVLVSGHEQADAAGREALPRAAEDAEGVGGGEALDDILVVHDMAGHDGRLLRWKGPVRHGRSEPESVARGTRNFSRRARTFRAVLRKPLVRQRVTRREKRCDFFRFVLA